MKVAIIQKEGLRALGYKIAVEYQMDTSKNAAYWANVDFSAYPAYPAGLVDKAEIATWYHPEDSQEPLAYDFVTVTDYEGVPEGFVEFNIPAAEFAVFTASETADTDSKEVTAKKVADTWAAIYAEWLPANPEYKTDHTKMYYELYTGGKAEIYIPIKK